MPTTKQEERTASGAGTQTWPELAVGLYEQLTGKQAEISYQFVNMKVDVPSHTGADAKHANWKVDGTLKISTRNNAA
ncbi:MAG: hypothetical protein KTR14_10095 [Vampirovibrio sp.]|nr:hypothetical protein [Vampirovibrio sp.]